VATTETDRFAEFFALLDLEFDLEPFQRTIVDEVFSARRETVALRPRGNGKSSLLAAVALWSLLRKPDAQIVVGAASRDQAAILFDSRAGMPATPRSPRWSRPPGARSAPRTAG